MKKRILSCLMALALCLTLLPATALAAGEHTHCICGAEHKSEITTHKDTEKTTFDKWLTSALDTDAKSQVLRVGSEDGSADGNPAQKDSSVDGWLLLAGAYYLKGEDDSPSQVTIDKPIVIRNKVTICLNGKTLQSTAENKPVFLIEGTGELTLTNCKGDGKVIHNSSRNGSGTGVQVNSGTFNLYGGTITKNTASQGGGVCVNSGTFNLYGGTITGNTAPHGGGVYVAKSATFNMYGTSSVTNNKTDNSSGSSGVGVYVNGGTFTMKDGTISGNNAPNYPDGGVGLYNAARFIMDGGTISGNEASQGGGVGVYHTATFIMNGGEITGNTATNKGGGVYVSVSGKGAFTMNGSASVKSNTATNNGGGVYVDSGTFNMNNGTIGGTNVGDANTATNGDKAGDGGHGGGVYVNSGTFNMNGDASIKNNKTAAESYGGGVFVKSGTFNMNDGAIGGTNVGDANTAFNGGGVYMWGGTFKMNDGAISGNIGNGVFVHSNATFTVSKTPTVKDNKEKSEAGNAPSNVFLMGGAYITIGGTLNEGASIGVTKKEGVDNGVIAESVSTDCSDKFFSDDTDYEVKYDKTDETNHKLVLKRKSGGTTTHEHKWTYTIKEGTENTIVATCANTTGDCDFNKDGGSVTITAPAHKTYDDGKSAKAQLTKADWRGEKVDENSIKYSTQDGADLDTAPTAVGKYKASITVGGATASVEYEITKKQQDPLKLTSNKNKIAVGETLRLTVTGGSTNSAVTCRITSGVDYAEIKVDVLTAKKAGTVTVEAVKPGDKEYAEARSEPLTIIITEKTGGGSTGGSTGGSSSGSSGGSSSGSSDSNPIIKTETKNNADGSTTKTETRKDGTVTATTTAKDGSVSKTETKKDGSSVTENKAADGSTGTIKTDKNGKTEMNAKVSAKAVENAKKSGEPVKAPVEVEASRNSGTAPTVKVELPQNSGKTEVEIPVSNASSGTVAVLVRPDGTEEILKDSIPTENGIRLTVDGSATVKIVDNAKGFIDTRNHWAKGEIDFVSARELVNGISATRYAPDATATRAQMWTILARQNDADLNGGNTWYEKAQLWSKDKGISDGTEPNAAINRAQMVTMLWRTMGQPAAGGAANFNDVPANSYYAQAVAWAVENGITTGIGGGRFDPNSTCTRAQIATFLARSMK